MSDLDQGGWIPNSGPTGIPARLPAPAFGMWVFSEQQWKTLQAHSVGHQIKPDD